MNATDKEARDPPSRGCSVVVLYNTERPHSAIGNKTPMELLKSIGQPSRPMG